MFIIAPELIKKSKKGLFFTEKDDKQPHKGTNQGIKPP